jgi:transcriptional regulator with XRE-family HTH domain
MPASTATRGLPFHRVLQLGLAVRGMSPGGLSEACGLTASHVSRILHGRFETTAETQCMLLDVLGISPQLARRLAGGRGADYLIAEWVMGAARGRAA